MGILIIIGSNLITFILTAYIFRLILIDLGLYVPVLASFKGFKVESIVRLKAGPKTKTKDMLSVLELTEKYGCNCSECLKVTDV